MRWCRACRIPSSVNPVTGDATDAGDDPEVAKDGGAGEGLAEFPGVEAPWTDDAPPAAEEPLAARAQVSETQIGNR